MKKYKITIIFFILLLVTVLSILAVLALRNVGTNDGKDIIISQKSTNTTSTPPNLGNDEKVTFTKSISPTPQPSTITSNDTRGAYLTLKNLYSWSAPASTQFSWNQCSNSALSLSGNTISVEITPTEEDANKISNTLVQSGWSADTCNNSAENGQRTNGYIKSGKRLLLISTSNSDAPEIVATTIKYTVYYEI